MHAVLADAALYEHTGDEPPTLDELTARYERQMAGRSPGGDEQWMNWVAVERFSGSPVGYVQATLAWTHADAPAGASEPTGVGAEVVAELAWVVGVRWQGRGYATQAARSVRGWLQAQGVQVFVAHIGDANIPSRRVATALLLEPTGEFVDGERTWRGSADAPSPEHPRSPGPLPEHPHS
jgi:RimJ/RimL family protein N-acetyltransferase